jgi:predicted unusual protein kinase regulating ubiquinone biosynthesis (AarF/ABC1/UbiB family)
VGARLQRARRALVVGRVARRGGILRVLAGIGVVGQRDATREGAQRFRQALEELGTTYIKLGQLLSSRPDLLPDVYIEELGHLVDEVPPVAFAEIDAIIRADLGGDVFASIDPDPLATASIAQTHRALLASGRDVVIKVRRPGIVEQVDLDLSVLRSTARLLAGHSATAQLLQVDALADELEVHLRQELDFVEEAHNTELVAGVISDYDKLVVPKVIRPYVTERVLVLEWIDGRKITAEHGLATDLAAELARQLFSAYVLQVVVEGVYRRPLSGIRAGQSLADLQRIALAHQIALPTSFALVGKTLAQADAVARTLDPHMDPMGLVEAEALEIMLTGAERRLEPNRLLAYLYTQLDPLTRMPRRLGHVLSELEQGSLKVGVVPTGLGELEANLRSIANRVGAAIIVGALLLASALLARVHRFEWMAFAGFCLAAAIGLYMVWKIIRTPGEL